MTLRLTKKLTLEKRVEVTDGQGGLSWNWVVLGYLWAKVEAASFSATTERDYPQMQHRARVIVRAAQAGSPSRPRPSQRFKSGTQIYTILAVEVFNAHLGYLVCHCEWSEVI